MATSVNKGGTQIFGSERVNTAAAFFARWIFQKAITHFIEIRYAIISHLRR
jgi:hypothetical protein